MDFAQVCNTAVLRQNDFNNTQGTPLLGGFLTTKYPGYPPLPPREGGSTMPDGGYLHDMSCNHPGLVNNPWDLNPGSSGTSSGIHPGSTPDLQEIAPEATGIIFFAIPGD